MKSFRAGIDSYSLGPSKRTPFQVLDWVKKNGGEGVQFSEVHLEEGPDLDRADWPKQCESRVRNDLSNMKAIVRGEAVPNPGDG